MSQPSDIFCLHQYFEPSVAGYRQSNISAVVINASECWYVSAQRKGEGSFAVIAVMCTAMLASITTLYRDTWLLDVLPLKGDQQSLLNVNCLTLTCQSWCACHSGIANYINVVLDSKGQSTERPCVIARGF